MDNKGQMSAELIIIMAAILSIAALFVGSMKSTTGTAEKKLESIAKKALRVIK